ncbi:MAG TPA: hypothetical protein PL033_13865 [Candidatus Brocadiia bacterium]|nr:hypothetical protein [Candidatus Brocadiia bacterium]
MANEQESIQPTEKKQPRQWDALTVAFPLAFIAVGFACRLLVPSMEIARFFPDDSFFYIKTAGNIAAGKGSTFDGINPTNGYHPLYMLWLVGVSLVKPLRGFDGVVTVFILDIIVTAAAFPIISIFLKRIGAGIETRLAALTACAGCVGFNDFGIEARLLLPLAWLFALRIVDLDAEVRPREIVVGLLGMLVCLARLDAVAFVGSLAFCAAFHALLPPQRKKLTDAAKRFVFLFGPAFAGLALFAAFNDTVYGRPATVSAWLKSGWPGTLATGWLATVGVGVHARFLLCAAPAIVYAAILKWRYRSHWLRPWDAPASRPEITIASLCCYNVAYLCIILLLSTHGTPGWYFSLALTTSIVILAALAESVAFPMMNSLPQRLPAIARTGMVVVSLVFGVVFVADKLQRESFQPGSIAMGLWMRDNLPPDAVIYQVDSCGNVAYFSERSVINGDGLINGWEYQDYARSGRLIEYLRKTRAQYIVWDEFKGEEHIVIPVVLWNIPDLEMSFSAEPERIIRFGKYALIKPELSSIRVTTPPCRADH